MIVNFAVISTLSALVPALVAAIFFRGLSQTLKILAYFLFFTIVSEGISLVLYTKVMNNLFLFHIYAYLELGTIALIFYRLSKSHNWRLMIKLLVAGFVVFSILNSIFLEGFLEFNSNQLYLECMVILVLCVGFFVEIMHKTEHVYLEKNPYFWLASSYMIYFAGNSLLFLFYNKMSDYSMDSYWDLHSTLNLCLNLGTTVSLWIGRKSAI